MRLTGRRESNNIEDRRGKSITNIAGIGGIGGVIIIVLITLLSGGDMGDIVNNVFQQEMQGQVEKSSERNQKAFTEEENKTELYLTHINCLCHNKTLKLERY